MLDAGRLERVAMFLELSLSSCGVDCDIETCIDAAVSIMEAPDLKGARRLVVDHFEIGPARAEVILHGLAPIAGVSWSVLPVD